MGAICFAPSSYFPSISEPICFLREEAFQWPEKTDKDISRQISGVSSASARPALDLTKSVDLENPAVLSEYLENKKYLFIASQIASTAIKQFRQTSSNSKYGQVFPIGPELLAYAMQLARNETVLEIAAADGKAGILLALAGAKKSYVNDILPDEMAMFRQSRETLPQEVSSKLAAIEGNCFDLLKLQPKLKESCGLVLCNNFIHFLNDKKMAELSDLLKRVLKIDGVGIITVNAKSGTEHASPNHTAFAQVLCLSVNYPDPYDPSLDAVEILGRTERAITGENVSPDYTNAFIYRKATFRQKWTRDASEMNKLTSEDKEFAREILKQQATKEKIKNIENGAIRILKTTSRKFDENDLKEFFTARGFKVESTFMDSKYNRVIAIIRRLK